jgi:hypothetical protein
VIAPGGQAFRWSHAIFLRRHGKAAFGFESVLILVAAAARSTGPATTPALVING